MSHVKQIFSFLILLIVFASCNKHNKENMKKEQKTQVVLEAENAIVEDTHGEAPPKDPIHEQLHSTLSKDVFLRFERTLCFGQCPSYIVIIYNSGKVSYEGKEWAPRQGMYTAQLSPDILEAIMNKAQEVDFFGFDDSYDNEHVTDLPSVITTLTTGQKFKTTVNRYQGPETLRTLERFIDDQLKDVKWQTLNND